MQNCAQAAPKIYCKDTSYDFGKIKAGEKINVTFKIENHGDETLKITNIQKSCGCTTFNIKKFPVEIASGKNFNLFITFHSFGKYGEQNLLINVLSNDLKQNPLKLNMSGNVEGKPQKDEIQRFVPDYFHVNIGEIPKGKIEDLPADEKTVFINYFYNDNCGECFKIERKILKPFEKKYKSFNVVIKKYNLAEKSSYLKLTQFEEAFWFKADKTPVVFFGPYFMQGAYSIEEYFNKAAGYLIDDPYRFIKETPALKNENITPVPESRAVIERFKKINALTIFGAGLIDGFNPCAFATFIFFIAFLFAYNYKKNEIITIGIVFIIISFLTYLLLGYGAFALIKKLSISKSITNLIDFAAAFFAAVFAFLNIRDFLIFKKQKNVKNISLQLPKETKNKIHEIIRNNFRRISQTSRWLRIASLLLASATVSFLVTLFESACTGQMYLPTLVFISNISSYKAKAFMLLCLYNFAFILPLIIVFLICLAGVSTQKVANFERKHFGLVKIITALIFIILSIIIILTKFM